MEASQPTVTPQPGFKALNKELPLAFHRHLPFLKFGPLKFILKLIKHTGITLRKPSTTDLPDLGQLILIVRQPVNGTVRGLNQCKGRNLRIQSHPSGIAVVLKSWGKLSHGELTVGDPARGAG